MNLAEIAAIRHDAIKAKAERDKLVAFTKLLLMDHKKIDEDAALKEIYRTMRADLKLPPKPATPYTSPDW